MLIKDFDLKKFLIFTITCLLIGGMPAVVVAENFVQPKPLNEVRIDQQLGKKLPLQTEFLDEHGNKVQVGQYFKDGKPVVLAFVYYECPMLCTLILNGLMRTLRSMKFTTGSEFEVVVVSFDSGETPELASAKKDVYMKQYDRENGEQGWHFLTGSEESVRALSEAAGFHYVYDEKTDEFAHASAIMVATPDGVLAKYFYGIEYPANDLRLALVEASDNRIGNIVDQILLFCFHYDPLTGKYGLMIMNILRVFGLLTIGCLGLFIATMLRRERMA